MLDEPTNHLDMNSIRWLETYLMNYSGELCSWSPTTATFLDRTVSKIIELENGRSTHVPGQLLRLRRAQKGGLQWEQQYRAYMNNQAQIRHQEEVIEKLRQFNREKSHSGALRAGRKCSGRRRWPEKPVELRDDMHLTFTSLH